MATLDAPRPVLVVDNFDSFVYNLVQYLGQLGVPSVVRRNDAVTTADRPVLVVDNFDSFVYNLVQYLGQLGVRCIVRRNDAVDVDELPGLDVAGVLLSPGPGTPAGAGVTVPMVRAAAEAGVLDRGRLAVHERRRAVDRRAEHVTDRLVSEADAEHGRPRLGRRADHRHADARVAGRAGAGGEQHAGHVEVGELGGGDRVVPPDRARDAELAQVLDQVVDEAVEVVDDEDGTAHVPCLHRRPPQPAAAVAYSMAGVPS